MDAARKKEVRLILQSLVDVRLDLENLLLHSGAEAQLNLMPTERGEAWDNDMSAIQSAINSIDSAMNDLEGLAES